jgi:yecA family protein
LAYCVYVVADKNARSSNPQEHLFGVFSSRRKPASEVLELEVELLGTRVKRTITIPIHFSLGDLHLALQIAVGWSNYHLHEFVVDGKHYSDPEEQEEEELDAGYRVYDEGNQQVGKIFDRADTITYVYDYGDQWEHRVTLLRRIAIEESEQPFTDRRVPRVTTAKNNCPPEDIGGIGGFKEFLELVKEIRKEESGKEEEDQSLSFAQRYDPKAFDLQYANTLFQGAFIVGDEEAELRRERAFDAYEAEAELLRHEQEPWFLVPQPYLPEEFTRLDESLRRHAPNPPELPVLAGFFCGLQLVPSAPPPSLWLALVFDFPEGRHGPDFARDRDIEGFLDVLFAAYNEIGTALSVGKLPLPFIHRSPEQSDIASAQGWAEGFFTAFGIEEDLSSITSDPKGEEALNKLALLFDREAERSIEALETKPSYSADQVRRWAMGELPEMVSYLYSLRQ